jgi:hypothetical protein
VPRRLGIFSVSYTFPTQSTPNELGCLDAYFVRTVLATYGEFATDFSLQGVKVSANFAQRPQDSSGIENCLLPSEPGPGEERRQKVFVLYGLGGIGKSQLAIDFARRHKTRFSSIFWLDGSNETSLKQSLARCGDRIRWDRLRDCHRQLFRTEGSTSIDHNQVLKWLALHNNTNWLLIFDNVDLDPRKGEEGSFEISDYLPGDHGHVLITTRLSNLCDIGTGWTQLEKVGNDLGRAIFQNWYHRDLGEFQSCV